MSWVPKPGRCSICGAEIMLNSSHQKYCNSCAALMRTQSSREYKDREIARRVAIKRGTDPDRYSGKEHECRVKGSCIHGANDSCMYLLDTGRLRISDGFMIENGKCAAYRRKRKNRRGTPKTAQGQMIPIGKMQET